MAPRKTFIVTGGNTGRFRTTQAGQAVHFNATASYEVANKFHKRAAAIPPLRILAEEDDAALVTAAKCGSTEAFEVLVRRHQARILSVAWRFTRNREDAEDITQQTFQKAFIHLRQFEGNSSFSTWLTRIAMNEAPMWLRRKRASFEVPIDESRTTTDEPALPPDFPDSSPSGF
jgi:hypothetical protein